MAGDPESLSPLAGERLERGERRVSDASSVVAARTSKAVLRSRAKAMRSEPTDAELALWRIVRGKRLAGFKFKRQVPIDRYIVDFVCFSHRLIIEADGGQHCESAYDVERDTYLRCQDFTVLRFWNSDILGNDEGVFEMIFAALASGEPAIEAGSPLPLSPTPLPQGERGFSGDTPSAPTSPARGEGLRP